MRQVKKKLDRYVRQILETLKREYGSAHPQAKIEAYRYNPASIRIRIIDPDFKGMNRVERDDLVSAILDTLPEGVRAEIMILLLLTPQESKTSPMSQEFDHPAPALL